jgi:DNA polymerase-1
VEFDYSQIELRIAAYLAREQTMLGLYSQGHDIHMAMAMRLTGKPQSEVSGHERKMAKAVNFGFLYGMGATKFMGTALSNYGILVTPEEAQAARTAFFAQFPGLLPWHARQRALAKKYKRVETPLGRVRHLPDIDSPDQGVRAEAERQAINSPVQGFASDLALLSFVRVCRAFRKHGFKAHAIGTVHDAINFEIPNEEIADALPLIKHTMENPPLEKLFNIHLDIPIIADCKVGHRWGGAKELTEEQVANFELELLEA